MRWPNSGGRTRRRPWFAATAALEEDETDAAERAGLADVAYENEDEEPDPEDSD